MASNVTNDRLSYGLTMLIFGLLFLLDKTGILAQIPYGKNLISAGAFFLIAGIVFLCTQPKKVLGWIFLAVGVFINANFFLVKFNIYSKYLVPIALVVVGLIMVFTSKKGK